MKASCVFDALRVLVAARQPVFVWGGPGIGKSAVVRHPKVDAKRNKSSWF